MRTPRTRRVPFIQQMTSTECGAACLAMIYRAHGLDHTVRTVRERVEIGRDGVSARAMLEHARAVGFDARGLYAGSPQALAQLSLPVIAHWERSHFVVIEKITSTGVHVVDPAIGRTRLTSSEFAEKFSGVVLEFAPSDTPAPRDDAGGAKRINPYVRLFTAVWRRSSGLFTAAAVATLLIQLLAIVAANVTATLIDDVNSPAASVSATAIAIAIAYLVALCIGTGAQAWINYRLTQRIDAVLGEQYFRKLARLPFSFFQSRSTGDLLARMASNTVMRDLLAGRIVASLIDLLFVVVFLVYLGIAAPLYLGVVLAIGALEALIVVAVFRPLREANQREVGADTEVHGFAADAVRSAEYLLASSLFGHAGEEWGRRFDRYLARAAKRRSIDAVAGWGAGFVRGSTSLLLTIAGVLLAATGAISIGEIVAYSILAGFALTPLANILTLVQSFQSLRVHVERVVDVLEEVERPLPIPAHDEVDERVTTTTGVALRFDDVEFRYPGSASSTILDADFTVAPGESIGIVGRSGSGKTTLIRLIAGLLTPTSGGIRRGEAAPDAGSDPVSVSVVTQDSTFFSDSIRYNLCFGLDSGSYTDADLAWALQVVGLEQEVAAMPLGLDTPLAEGGSFLSGGERQRIALARALLRKPALLVLDEATSHLDSVTEASIARNLEQLNITRVIVAHRLSTVRNCDAILVIDRGRVVAMGRHQDLIDSSPHYQDLVNAQEERRALDV